MTRAEYEAKYGTAPVIPSSSPSTASAPVTMTRAQYTEKYGTAPSIPKKEKNLFDKLGQRVEEGVSGFTKELMDPKPDILKGPRLFARPLGALGRGVGDVVEAGIKALPGNIEEQVGKVIAPVVAPIAEKVVPAYQKFAEAQPELAQDVSDIGGISNLFGAGVLKKSALTAIEKVIPEASVESLSSKVVSDFNKSVKPTFSGATKGQLDKKNTQVTEAVKIIQNNAPNLKFVDDSGEIVSGSTPKTIQQLGDAVDQTKRNIFSQYSTMPKEAGDLGLKIKTEPIATELDAVVNNKALQLTNPETVAYAKSMKDRYENIGDLEPEMTQDVIQNLNESLKAFYKNPTYADASKAAIDAMVANNLRKMLDEGIEKLSGPGYQDLKNQYSSLKSIERDVVKAAAREAKKAGKGLIDFTDIFTGGDILQGVITLNPGAIARGAVGRGIKEFYKYMNNPNRGIEGMFKTAEKIPTEKLFKGK